MLITLLAFMVSSLLQAQSLHIVEVKDVEFVPANINISVGDTVEWRWIDGQHTTTSDSTAGQNVWDAPIDVSNQTFRFVITSPGVHNYHCTPHLAQGMVGTITATPVSSVNTINNPVQNFRLDQNYPNPFNPSTTIEYSIPERGNVVLTLYNVLGSKVMNLVNEFREAGQYKYNFIADGLSSGIYFYKLSVNDFSSIKKMILLR